MHQAFVPSLFCYMFKLLNFLSSLTVGNLKPKVKPFLKLKFTQAKLFPIESVPRFVSDHAKDRLSQTRYDQVR